MTALLRKMFIIVVHYGDVGRLHSCLKSLLGGSVLPDKIIVVDHNLEPTQLGLPSSSLVTVMRPSTNDGYGAGLNFGIGALFSDQLKDIDIVVGMNNDIVVAADALAQLQQWWQRHPEPALVGVVAQEGSRTVNGFGRVNPWSGRAKLVTKHHPLSPTSYPTYIHGAFIVAPWELLMKVRGWPENYFLYWEDVAFSWRARAAGFPLRLARAVTVTHAASPGDDRMSDDKLYYLVRNGVLCLTREGPGVWRVWWKLHTQLRLLYHRLLGQQPLVLQALRDGLAGIDAKRI